jgi:two-component system CheB/CheR fusion protein
MNGTRTYVLVVDDVRDAADSMSDLLAVWGYEADARYCGASALAAVHSRRPDAVLLDIAMPRMCGFEFAARLRELPGCQDTPVVVVSGYTGKTYQARGRELGITHYLYKPADPTLVRVLLERLISAQKPSRTVAPRLRCLSLGGEATNSPPVGEVLTGPAPAFGQAV